MYPFCDVVIYPPFNLSPFRLFRRDCQRKCLFVEGHVIDDILYSNSLGSSLTRVDVDPLSYLTDHT